MTGLVYLRQDDALYVLTDGASYTDDGIVTSIEPKVAVMPDIRMVIFTRGPAGSAHLALYTWLDEFASFDKFSDDSVEHVKKLYFDNESWMRRGGHPDLEFYFFGYSERRSRLEGYQIRCGYADSACYYDQKIGRKAGIRKKPFVRIELPELSLAPGLFDKSDLAAAGFPTHLKPRFLSPEVDMLHLMEMLRRTPCARFPDQPKRICVGGHALLTRVDRDGITQKILVEYPDVVGEPIRIPEPLDWQRWRAGSRNRARKMTTPANDNNIGEMEAMSIGRVKMYDDERGFGFIRSDDHAADVFVHAKSLLGMSELIPGQVVEFSAVFDEVRRKYQAADVRII